MKMMPFGIRLPHLQLSTGIGSTYLSYITPTYVCCNKKAIDEKFGAKEEAMV